MKSSYFIYCSSSYFPKVLIFAVLLLFSLSSFDGEVRIYLSIQVKIKQIKRRYKLRQTIGSGREKRRAREREMRRDRRFADQEVTYFRVANWTMASTSGLEVGSCLEFLLVVAAAAVQFGRI